MLLVSISYEPYNCTRDPLSAVSVPTTTACLPLVMFLVVDVLCAPAPTLNELKKLIELIFFLVSSFILSRTPSTSISLSRISCWDVSRVAKFVESISCFAEVASKEVSVAGMFQP